MITLDQAKTAFFDIDEPLKTEWAIRYMKHVNARDAAQNIPGWYGWDETQTHEWGLTNIGTPLTNARNALAGIQTLNLTAFKTAMTTLLNILDAMWIMQWAMARMLIALRDDNWP